MPEDGHLRVDSGATTDLPRDDVGDAPQLDVAELVVLVDTDGMPAPAMPRIRRPRWTPPYMVVAEDAIEDAIVSAEIEDALDDVHELVNGSSRRRRL